MCAIFIGLTIIIIMFSILQKTLNINFVKVFLLRLLFQAVLLGGIDCIKIKARHRNGLLLLSGFYYVV